MSTGRTIFITVLSKCQQSCERSNSGFGSSRAHTSNSCATLLKPYGFTEDLKKGAPVWNVREAPGGYILLEVLITRTTKHQPVWSQKYLFFFLILYHSTNTSLHERERAHAHTPIEAHIPNLSRLIKSTHVSHCHRSLYLSLKKWHSSIMK